MIRTVAIFGTRPEAIKMAPVIQELARHPDEIVSKTCVTAQHREMLDQVLSHFAIIPDFDLNLMRERQPLALLTSALLPAITAMLHQTQPDWIIVQGDTTTAMVAALAAFYQKIRIAHIEAGLRTYQKDAPFPEEINRRYISLIADIHFAPTETARQALLAEKVPGSSIYVTGNTGIDALYMTKNRMRLHPPSLPEPLLSLTHTKVILVTGHRRENIGGFEQLCLALKHLARLYPHIAIVWPLHPHPAVREPIVAMLSSIQNIFLIDPLSYAPFIWLMNKAEMILTDSGGVQEEAVALGRPVLVLRETTERREGVEAKRARMVGLHREHIVREVCNILNEPQQHSRGEGSTLYGDGTAASRIVHVLLATCQIQEAHEDDASKESVIASLFRRKGN